MHFWCEGFGLGLGLRWGSGACSQGIRVVICGVAFGVMVHNLKP